MANQKIIDRQHPFAAVSPALGIANIGADAGVEFAIRPNTLVLRVLVFTAVAFDGTTNTATVGDGTTVFANAVDIKTVGAETVANAPKFYPIGGTITANLAQTGDATVGQAFVVVEYVILGNGNAGIEA